LSSFILGYFVDILSSPVLGLNAFAMSLVFLSVYLSSRWIRVQNPFLSPVVVFFASCVKGTGLILVWSFFFGLEGVWVGALKYFLFEAILAAVLAPGLFFLLSWGEDRLQEVRMPL
jgi:rod shape-determining protein MreD